MFKNELSTIALALAKTQQFKSCVGKSNEWCSVNSYKGWLMWCDSYRLCEKYLTPIQEVLDNYYNTKIKGKAAEVI